jgi:hypothetical protein
MLVGCVQESVCFFQICLGIVEGAGIIFEPLN